MIKENDKFKLVEIKKSTNPNKKYMAIVLNKKTGKENKIHFGGIKTSGEPYEQYKDNTGLGLYTKYNHLDKARRERYRERHKGEGDKERFPSPAYFSWWYLWP